jgi:two-component system response regulator WspF
MRVAIVNDVPLATEVLRRVVASDPRHTVAWTAADGQQAVERCRQDTPDVILMDLLMPVLNGAQATRQIMRQTPCAILVVTATVSGNFSLVCEALGYGAYDAVCTPTLRDAPPAQAGAELLAKLAQVERINRRLGRPASTGAGGAVPLFPPCAAWAAPSASAGDRAAPKSPSFPLVVMGSSTGGPTALQTILSCWPQDFPAGVVVAQHIGVDFAAPLVQWLQQSCRLPVSVVRHGDAIRPSAVYIAGTNDHLVLARDGSLSYTREPEDYPYRPSVDALFHSAGMHWPAPGIAILLTGLGRDGAQGMLALKQAGWSTIAQDQATSVVYGMPQAAAQIGAAQRILPVQEIASYVNHQLQRLAAC